MAYCCNEFTGIVNDCSNSIPGVERIWLACKGAVTAPTVTDDEVTALGTPVSEFKEFNFGEYTAYYTSDFTVDDNGGYWSTELYMQFSKMETEKRRSIQDIVTSDTIAIVEDNNGRYWYVGFDKSLRPSAGQATTGTALGDFNGYSVTLTAISFEPPIEITAEAMNAILNPTP